MIPEEKIYSNDTSTYTQRSVRARIEALFLNNLGKVVTRQQIIRAATNPETGIEPENWHQRLSELRTDSGYTILSKRDWSLLTPEEYVMPHTDRRAEAARRVLPSLACWQAVLARANHQCEWTEDGQKCNLAPGDIDPIGGGTVRLTADHMVPHSINPASDPDDPTKWQALCGRHQVMKKNYWDSSSGKINLMGILQSVSKTQKLEALEFLTVYFNRKKN